MHSPVLAIEIGALIAAIPLAFVVLIGLIPIMAIVTYHRRKVLEIKLAGVQKSDQAMIERIEAVRQELAQLRDTATQYDVSFDTALRRIESRVNNLDSRVAQVEQQSTVGVPPGI